MSNIEPNNSLGLDNQTYTNLKTLLANRESSNNQYCENTLGYLGKYQFGAPALTDTGFINQEKYKAAKKGKGWQKEFLADESNWNIPGGKQAFMSNVEYQEQAMDKLLAMNAKTLRKELEQQGAIFHSSSDTEVLIHLIRRSKKETFKEQLKESLNIIKGGFTYLVLTENTLYGAVDPNSFRPLAIGKMKNGAYVTASETCALDIVGAEFVCNVGAGELVSINDEGIRIEKYTEDTQVAIAAMEYVYFARPDSNIAGINVHSARKRTGRALAKEQPTPDADMVIGVPNSSLSAASGYAEESGLPYEMGLIKNQYVARTFIQPTQELREQGVRMKLSPVRGVVQGKSIVLVDDSIVRGTTCKRIVKMLKEAGAREVHVRIACPPLMFPSFYGIDISTTEELISANKTNEEICEIIGADSLGFLSEQGLIDSIGLNYDAPYSGLCMECYNGDYSAGLYDYEESYVNSMTDIQKQFLKERGRM